MANLDLVQQLKKVSETDFTKTTHSKLYPAIRPSRPELNQAGRVILITGGGTGVGYGIARAFIQASADTVIIVGRRVDVLEAAASSLKQDARTAGTNTKIINRAVDIANFAEVDTFWKSLADDGIIIDVFVANAAKFTETQPILELGADEVWSQVEANAKSPLYFVEKLYSQPGNKQKFVVNVSTAAIHLTGHRAVAVRPAYTLSKMTGTLLFQLIAQNTSPEKMQIVSFHPGQVYNDMWKSMDLPPEIFDNDDLCGAFAVWATTKKAEFLHGRFVWAAWDVEELSTGEIRKRIDEDPYFLRSSIVGLNGSLRA